MLQFRFDDSARGIVGPKSIDVFTIAKFGLGLLSLACALLAFTASPNLAWATGPNGEESTAAKKTVKKKGKKPEKKKKDFWDKTLEVGEKALDAGADAGKKVGHSLAQSRPRREKKNWGVHGHYSFLDTWVPSKYGLSFYSVTSANSTWELEYTRGSLSYGVVLADLLSITEQRVSLNWRSFSSRNSFYFSYGVFYNDFEFVLGDKLLASVDASASVDLVKIQSMGLSWGVGNRWQTEGKFTWGFDWFAINIPLVTLSSEAPYIESTTDEDDRDEVREAMDVIEKIPTFVALKVQLGVSW